MMLDTEALRGTDLTTDHGRSVLYGMIREFFLRVPREFRAEIGARADEDLTAGVPVFLGSPRDLASWDGTFLDFCQERFATDWPGERLVWLGSSEWRERGARGFHAYISLPTRTGYVQSTPDAALAVALSPGRCPEPGKTGDIQSRREGRAYRNDWQRALAAKPELVIIDSWNDFAQGTEIAPSRQYGVAYVDTTRYFQSRMGSQQRHYLRAKQRRLPAVMKPGTDYHIEFLVENAGTRNLHTGRRVSVTHRIRQRSDGRLVQKKTAAQELTIASGQTRRLPVRVSTRGDDGKPLPEGEYLFSLSVARSKVAYLRSRWLSRTVAELEVPITVGQPPPRKATVVSTSLPSAIEAGAVVSTVVRLRNDGAETWRRGEVLLAYHWVRHRDGLGGVSSEARQTAARDVARAELPRDVAPGQIVSVMIPVRAVTADGRPLPAVTSEAGRSPDGLWHYRLQWDLVSGDGRWFADEGRPAAEEAIQVVARDPGASIRFVGVPPEVSPGSVARVRAGLANVSSRAWTAGDPCLAASWFRWDGRELPEATVHTSLPSNVGPGETVEIEADVSVPSSPGNYWLALRAECSGDESEAASQGLHRDLAVSPVLVRASGMRALDLSPYANVTGVTTDGYRARGEFDERGRSLPAEWTPPDLSGPREHLYQSGYYSPGTPRAPAVFAFPDTSSGTGGVVACNGQSIELGDKPVARVHLLAASTAGTGEATFGLRRAAGEIDELPTVVPSWTGRVEGVPVGAYAPYIRHLAGDDPSVAGYLHHLTLASPTAEATTLVLPQAPWVKLVAVTVEHP
jgi:hypothetical protein